MPPRPPLPPSLDPRSYRGSPATVGLRLLALALLLGFIPVVLVNFWFMSQETEPVERVAFSFSRQDLDPGKLPPALQQRFGPDAGLVLARLNEQRRLQQTSWLNPYSGARLRRAAFTLLGQERILALPSGMLVQLCRAVDVGGTEALFALLLDKAMAAIRDPRRRLAQDELRAHVQAEILEGARQRLESVGAQLDSAPLAGPRPRLLLRGQSHRYAVSAKGVSEWERASFHAWTGLVAEHFAAQGVPCVEHEFALQHGKLVERTDSLSRSLGLERSWVEGWYDFEAHFRALAQGEQPQDRPFWELGQLYAWNLLNQAGLVEVVFLGHGIDLRARDLAEERWAPFKLLPLAIGDEVQEILTLGHHRERFSIRYGICMAARTPFVAVSCSNKLGDTVEPEDNASFVSFLLENGWYPDPESMERFSFRMFKALQAGLRGLQDDQQMERVVAQLVRDGQPWFSAPGEIRRAVQLQEEVFLLRAGGAETPDLLLITEVRGPLERQLALRLQCATMSWRLLEQTEAGLEPGAPYEPCPRADCDEALQQLAAQAREHAQLGKDPWSPSRVYQLRRGLRRRLLAPAPNAANRFLRLALLRGEEQPIQEFLRQALALQQAFSAARLQGLILAEQNGALMDLAALEGLALREEAQP